MAKKTEGLTVKLTKKAIEIKLPLSVIPVCVEHCPDMYESGARVIDIDEFAKDVLHELEDEDESGATMVHRLFDAAFMQASEQGSLGIAIDGEDE